MQQLNLAPDECEILNQVLENELADLRMEISDTDSQDFRTKLKQRKQVLQKVLVAIQDQN